MQNVFGFGFFLVLMLLMDSSAMALNESPQTFTLDGQLFQVGTETPLLDANAKLTVQIINPNGTCLLYSETQYVDTTSSDGYFHINVGSATGAVKRAAGDPGRTMSQIFQNTVAIAAADVSGQTCAGATYTPAAGDVRYFRIIVTPSATNVADTLTPDLVIDSVPQAIVAQSLQGLERASILQVNNAGTTVLTQVNLDALFTTPAYTNLQSILAGNFLRTDTSGASLPSYAANPAGVAAGDIWYDSTLNQIKFYNGSTSLALGISGAAGAITSSDVTTALTYTPVNKAGDTMTGPLNNNSSSASTALAISQSGAGSAATFMGGKVGIGIASPAATLDVRSATTSIAGSIYSQYQMTTVVPSGNALGLEVYGTASTVSTGSAQQVGATYGSYGSVIQNSSNNLWVARGVYGNVTQSNAGGTMMEGSGVYGSYNVTSPGTTNTGSGVKGTVQITGTASTTLNAIGGNFDVTLNSTGGNVNIASGLSASVTATNGSIANARGLYIGDIQGTNRWSVYASDISAPSAFVGGLAVGKITAPTVALDISGSVRATGQMSAEAAVSPIGTPTATVNFATGNTQVLQNVGASAITLNNMTSGGSYLVIVTDATSRTYTFTNCTNTRFNPANAATTAATTTLYNIVMATISGQTYCFISWSSGYQ